MNKKCTEKDIQEAFAQFGQIHEIVMPQKKNHFAGFCFVQFMKFPDATKAVESMNGKSIKGRVVAVDWAVPKDTYMTAVLEEKQASAKKTVEESESVKENNDAHEPGPSQEKEASDGDDDDDDDDDDDSDNNDSDNDENSNEELEDEDKKESAKKGKEKLRTDSAIEEGRTLFIRSIPFDVDNDEFRSFFEKFGPVKYALICKYPNTDHSKGSGFVQFVEKSSADACLKAATNDGDNFDSKTPGGLFIKQHRLVVCPAISRTDVKKIEREKQDKQPKDKRNLHLLRVGLVRVGTEAANGMSAGDSALRLRIESANRAKIKNLHIFVSPTRLCIHNIPTQITDKELRAICVKAVDDKTAKITECRIMRDFNRVNADGVGRSRGFGFVEFVSHDHAYKCLANLNNNPSIFTASKRPIVEFSLENRQALIKKTKSLEASRIKQQERKNDAFNNDSSSMIKPPKRKLKKVFEPPVVKPISGSVKVSTQKPFPSHFGPKIRHKKRTHPEQSDQSQVNKKKKFDKNSTTEKCLPVKRVKRVKSSTTTTTAAAAATTAEDTNVEVKSKKVKRPKKRHWYEDNKH